MEKAGQCDGTASSWSYDDSISPRTAEAINRSFNEIKSYVENRRHNLLQSLKTTKDDKLKILNDQLNVILSKSNFFSSLVRSLRVSSLV